MVLACFWKLEIKQTLSKEKKFGKSRFLDELAYAWLRLCTQVSQDTYMRSNLHMYLKIGTLLFIYFNLNIWNLRNLSLGNINDTNKQVSKLLTKVPKTWKRCWPSKNKKNFKGFLRKTHLFTLGSLFNYSNTYFSE